MSMQLTYLTVVNIVGKCKRLTEGLVHNFDREVSKPRPTGDTNCCCAQQCNPGQHDTIYTLFKLSPHQSRDIYDILYVTP